MKASLLGAVGFAVFHLYMIGCGALECPLGRDHLSGRLLGIYAAWSGTGGDYSFYSNIGETTIARITSINKAGETSSHELGATASEVDLRLNSMLDSIFQLEDADLQARALAAYELGRRTHSQSATVQFLNYGVPSMASYRNGARPGLKEFYRAEFIRQDQ